MKKRLGIVFLSFLCILRILVIHSHAAIITVNKYGGGDYTTIQEAVDNADPGDTIKVSSGVYYENIVVGKNVDLLGAGATGVIPEPPSKSVAYIVNDDYTTANSYREFLVSLGFSVIQVEMADVPITNFNSFDLIIIGPDTGNLGNWGTPAAVTRILSYSGPGLGLGEGGYAAFGKFSLFIGWPNGWHGGTGQSTYAMNTSHAVWNTPNHITMPASRIITLYTGFTGFVALYMPTPQSGVVGIGRQSDDINHYLLIEEDTKYFLWGFDGSPSAMTQDGRDVMENVAAYLLNITSGVSRKRSFTIPSDVIISPTLLLPSWWEVSILRPDWWRLLLPSGTTIYGNGSGNVVTFTNVGDGRIDGFSIVNSGSDHNYAGIRLNSSSVDVSNNRITRNANGIYALNSASVIRNNMIDNNGADNGYADYGIICNNSSLGIFNNLIINNPEVGIYVAWPGSSGTSIINNTILNNVNDGIWCYQSSPTIKNNIIAGNGYGISAIYSSAPNISYNDVWGNTKDYDQQTGGTAGPGTGDISEDPLFVDAANGDYHLTEGSPCIDTGDPNPIYNDPDGTRNDMGAYGGISAILGPESSEESGFIFTSVGKIPVSEIVQDDSDPSFGLAKVDPNIAGKLAIYPWRDSPFGGSIWLYGLFGEDDPVDYYQILIGKWNGNIEPDPNDPNDFVPLTTPLTKVKYTIEGGKVKHEYVSMGPFTEGGIASLYTLNKGGYWSQPDLRMIWNTTTRTLKGTEYVPIWENGKYTLRYKAFRWITFYLPTLPPQQIKVLTNITSTLPPNDQDHITLMVNNSPVTTQIHMVKYDPSNPLYNPATDGEIEECAIIRLTNDHENLRFVITASHPEGYLDYYTLDCLWGKNQYGGIIKTESYPSAPSATPPTWGGVNNQEFQIIGIPPGLPGRWDHWEECAYQFRLRARSRATDGYTHLYWSEFNDHYTIDLGTAFGIPGDINGDGVVDIGELTQVINAFLGNL